MKILQVIPAFVKGGAERVVVEISNNLEERNHEVTCLVLFEVEPKLNANKLLSPIHKLNILEKLRPNGINLFLTLKWIIKKRKFLESFDVIHCHLTFGLLFGAITRILFTIFRHNKTVFVFTWHFVGVHVSSRIKFIHWLCIPFFDFIVFMAQTRQIRKFLNSRSKSKFRIIANGIKPIQRKSESTFPKNATAGTLSRLVPERRPKEIMEVFICLINLKANTRIRVGGTGPELSFLEKLVFDHQIQERVTFHGLVTDSESFLSEIDFYVTLSVGENLGISGIEAISMGIPTYGLEISGDENGKPSYFFSSKKPLDIATQIAFHMESPRELSKYIKQQYEVFLSEYTAEVMTDRYLSLYDEKFI